jgi:membrane dipeptidase
LARTVDLLAAARQFCSQSKHFRIAESMSAAREIIRAGFIAIALSLEGCDALGGDIRLLKEFRKAGVLSVGLTHVSANDFADASTATPVHGGLSILGRQAVMEMNSLGMVIDVSHCSDEAVSQVLDVSVQPVIASHSCCRALCQTPRNLPNEFIRAIADGGGVVCVACHAGFLHPGDMTEISPPIVPPPGQAVAREALDDRLVGEHQAALRPQLRPKAELTDLADHVEHALRLAGPNGVAIGSDFDGGITPPRGYQDVSRRPYLAAELIRRGHSGSQLRSIFGRNLIRVFDHVQMVSR